MALALPSSTPAVSRRGLLKSSAIAALMLMASAAAYKLTPTQFLADERPAIQLEQMLPKQFGPWKLDPTITPLVVDPSQLELINKIYTQTLSRTYVNDQGDHIMVSVAYGKDQSEAMQVHTPEACYPAQGFKISSSAPALVPVGQAQQQAVMRLTARKDQRVEPITYWVVIGDRVVNEGGRERRDARIHYGLRGLIPDGTFFRISSIGPDVAREFKVQDAFIASLAEHMSSTDKRRLFGLQQTN